MPSISKIRFTNVIYEGGNKRYNDETFLFDGHNGAILLENGGGKTVFIQTVLQAVLPHADLADRKMKDTLKLEDAPAHVAVEWILNEHPRRYALTCVSLFLTKDGLDSYRYVFEYGENDNHSIGEVPFVKPFAGKMRPSDRGEIQEYYSHMAQTHMNAKIFDTIKSYKVYLEQNYHIIPKEWESIVKINSAEVGVRNFFDECKTTGQLFDRLLIPTVEESMTGFQKDEFAETFDKHRESFKEYKQLKEKIAENERIKERVEGYVKAFAVLEEKRRDYQETKGIAKAYFHQAKKQQKQVEEEHQQLTESFETLREKQKQLEQKESSYEIAVEKERLDQVSNGLKEEINKQTEVQEKLDEADSFYYSLKLAEYKKSYRIEEQSQMHYEEKLAELDKEFDTEEIRDELDENAQGIKGYFVALEDQLKKEQQEIQFELNSISNSLESENQVLVKVKTEQRDLLNQKTRNETILEKNHGEMNDLQSVILSNPKQEKVEEQLPIWIQKINDLDTENAQLINRNKELKNENNGLTEQLNLVHLSLQNAHKKESEYLTKKRKNEEEHQNLKLKLAERKMAWSRLESVYLKQDSIEKQFIEEINKLEVERDHLLDNERLAFRFVDDYGSQDTFHADAYLSKQMEQWKNQFSYIESGVSYIQSLPDDATSLIEKYPLWPITLITTTKEKTKVQEKVRHLYDRIQYPVNVLSMDEATAIVHEEDPLYSQWIQPKHWESNSDTESFVHWKENILQSAQEVKQNRQAKEKELQSWKQLQNDLYTFIHQYPFGGYQELSEQLTKVKEQIFQASGEERKLKEKQSENEKEYSIHEKKQIENKDLINGYGTKIEKGQKYLKVKKENETLQTELLYVNDKRNKLEVIDSKIKKTISDFQERADELKKEKERLSIRISDHIYGDRLYQKVKNVQPVFTSKTIETLEQKRQDLERALEHLSKGRSELESSVKNAKQNMERLQREVDQLRKEKNNLNEELEFPLHGTEKMNELWSKRNEWDSQLKSLMETVGKLTTEHDRLEGSIDAKIDTMLKKVDEVIQFEQHLEPVRKQLDEEKIASKLEDEQLNQMSRQLDKQLKMINAVVFDLEKYDPKHLFLDAFIKEAILSNEEIIEFTYSGKRKVGEIIGGLEARYESLQNERNKVDRAKATYINFCRQDIIDIRMREMAIQGIENKQTYDEVLKYKELLEGRIHTAIKYAEQNIITHDQQLEQFIIHIHTHIKKIADELKLIPKKTSVKVEDHWKEIYSFHIPEWDEQEGKSEIREYIHWILEQLNKEGYKDENGHDDTGKVKKDLEKWLQSKQLLQVVMKNQKMKVTCRKVTNDSKVTKGTYSWEQSNVWSGGEKWSKNMTLFLGILNYIAEKRASIQKNMKRHRTVIVDNPFGKASSDHVLNPVFFIAEQLGFQMIALTAHVEGKFLRDYFPVIYSCRLRNAAGSEKQIMTKEKNIQHAYFRDHDPKVLERLGEVE